MRRSRAWWVVVAPALAAVLGVLLLAFDADPTRPQAGARLEAPAPATSGVTLTPPAAAGPAAAPQAAPVADPLHVSGRVRLRRGAVWPGVTVVATRDGVAREAQTGEDGAFALRLEPGAWTVSLRPRASLAAAFGEAGGPWPPPAADAPFEQRVDVVPGEARPLDVRVRSDVVIAGRVVDDDTGAPVAGADVWVAASRRHEGSAWSAVTGPDGRFAIVVEVPPTSLTQHEPKTHVRAPGWASAGIYTLVGGTVTGEAVADLVVRLQRPCPLRGRVVTPDGLPVADAEVVVTGHLVDQGGWRSRHLEPGKRLTPGGDLLPWEWRARTATDGTFAVDDLPATRWPQHAVVSVKAHADDHDISGPAREVAVGPEGAHVTLTLVPATTISGAVVDLAGHPLRGARVTRYLVEGARFQREGDREQDSGPGRWGDARFVARRPGWSVGTKADGSFTLQRFAAGRHTLAVWAEGHGERLFEVEAPASDLRFVLAPERLLAGRVLDEQGAGVAGALVRVVRVGSCGAAVAAFDGHPEGRWDGVDERGAAVTGGDGAFMVAGLAEPRVDVLVLEGRSVVATRANVVTPVDGLELVATTRPEAAAPAFGGPAGRLEVSVEHRRPARHISVEVVHATSQARVEGELRLGPRPPVWRSPPVEAGPVRLTVRVTDFHGGVVERTAAAQVVEGRVEAVTVRFE